MDILKERKHSFEKAGEICYDIGIELCKEENYKEAYDIFVKAAKEFDHLEAYVEIGYMFDEGEGLDVDHEQAMFWFKQAASKGHEVAQHNVGLYYFYGKGVSVDFTESMRWYKMAAENNCPPAQYAIGFMYQFGKGVDIDQKEAFQWYKKAGHEGHSEAQYRVGYAYKNGLGIAEDSEKALQWYLESARNHCSAAQLKLGITYLNGFGIKKNYEQAIKWFTRSNHFSISKLCLGHMYESGLGVKRDEGKAKQYFNASFDEGQEIPMIELGMMYLRMYKEAGGSEIALHWFKKAARQKNVDALAAIGSMYLTGAVDGESDISKAYSYLSQAAVIKQFPFDLKQLLPSRDRQIESKNHSSSMKWYYKTKDGTKSVKFVELECISGLSCLGYLYHKGIGVQQDFNKARELYLNVLERIDDEDSDANMCLGLLYSKGLGVDRNYEKAINYFNRSAKKVNTYAYNIIGDAYRFGNGVEKDFSKAMEWYMKGVHCILLVFKSYANGCKEAQRYIQILQEIDQANINSSVTTEDMAREVAETQMLQLIAELARVDPKNEALSDTNALSPILLDKPMDISNNTTETYQFFHLDDIQQMYDT